MRGFNAKHDSGNVRVWGGVNKNWLSDWEVLGGPIIGFYHHENYKSVSLIVGDKCRPKYFGARKLTVLLGEKRKVKFYWQELPKDYFSECLSKGFLYLMDNEQLKYVEISKNRNIAEIFPSTENIYS